MFITDTFCRRARWYCPISGEKSSFQRRHVDYNNTERYMLHDPGVYPDPEAFKPERHLRVYEDGSSKKDRDVPTDPTKIAFGFGRRWALIS